MQVGSGITAMHPSLHAKHTAPACHLESDSVNEGQNHNSKSNTARNIIPKSQSSQPKTYILKHNLIHGKLKIKDIWETIVTLCVHNR